MGRREEGKKLDTATKSRKGFGAFLPSIHSHSIELQKLSFTKTEKEMRKTLGQHVKFISQKRMFDILYTRMNAYKDLWLDTIPRYPQKCINYEAVLFGVRF